jgi:UDP-glucose 4-epimerase
MAKCLVTGHRGYIGTKVYNQLIAEGHEVIGIDKKDGHDILDIMKEDSDGSLHPHYFNFQPEFVFHLAAQPRVAFSVNDPVYAMRNNALVTSLMLNFCRKVGSVRRFIFSSSSSVVGNGSGPESPYALQKQYSEKECRMYNRLYGLDTVSLRYFNVYSPDQPHDGPYTTAIANWMEFIRKGKQPYITGTGEQRRDMVNVKDVVSANIFAMNYEGTFDGQVFDVGTGDNISLNEVVGIINNHFPNIIFNYVEERLGDVLLTKADPKPLMDLGWKAQIDIETGITGCFEGLL